MDYTKMKTIYLFFIIGFSIIGIVVASDLVAVNNFTKDVSIDKEARDFLLTQAVGENKAPLEINPAINIDCSETECKWSAYQEGVISTYDNILNKKYCVEYKTGTRCLDLGYMPCDGRANCTEKCHRYSKDCIAEREYTTEEIENIVSTQVTQRLINYANSEIKEGDKSVYTKVSEGELNIGEKK